MIRQSSSACPCKYLHNYDKKLCKILPQKEKKKKKKKNMDFWQGSKYGSWQYCQILCLYSYHAYFILSLKSENLFQKEIKDWVFEVHLLTKETSSWFPLNGSVKMTCARSYAHGSWIIIKRREFELFFYSISYPNSVKQRWYVQSQWKDLDKVSFHLPKVSKININFELLRVSKMTSLKIYYLQSRRC